MKIERDLIDLREFRNNGVLVNLTVVGSTAQCR